MNNWNKWLNKTSKKVVFIFYSKFYIFNLKPAEKNGKIL